MSRVQLTDLENLYPMFTDGDPNYTPSEKSIHTGLTIYNVPEDPSCPVIEEGLYVWDGKIWVQLKEKPKDHTSFDPVTGILTDYEGNEYSTKVFGTQRWMTQNLRSLRDADGRLFVCPSGSRINPAHYNKTTNGAVEVKKAIPEGGAIKYTENGIEITQTYKEYAEKFGLYYIWQQASKACPRGWHLPTPAEWDIFLNFLGGKGVAAKKLKANDYIYKSADGRSFNWGGYPIGDPDNSGFNAYPVGYIEQNRQDSRGFSSPIYWWTATSGVQRWLNYDSDAMQSPETTGKLETSNVAYGFSVRCIQD